MIRFPFEQMTLQNEKWNLVRINKGNVMTWKDIEDKSILIEEDIDNVVKNIEIKGRQLIKSYLSLML